MAFFKNIFLLFISALYVVSPIDIIPDVMIGVGQIDDLAVILNFFRVIYKSYKNFKLGQKLWGIFIFIIKLAALLIVIFLLYLIVTYFALIPMLANLIHKLYLLLVGLLDR